MIIAVKRQKPGAEPFWQEFEVEATGRQNVAQILDAINCSEPLLDAKGNPASRVKWECSCMQKACGACAMVIDGKPALACATFVDASQNRRLTIEPLSKFPVVEDLQVDRSVIFDRLRDSELFLGTRDKPNHKEFETQYAAAKCLKCGLCLEVCPNYVGPEGRFGGAVFANEAYLMASNTSDRKRTIKKQYNKHFAAGCSKSLACRDICPVSLETLSSIGYMNR